MATDNEGVEDSRYELKLAVAGDLRTGKTCLVNRFVDSKNHPRLESLLIFYDLLRLLARFLTRSFKKFMLDIW